MNRMAVAILDALAWVVLMLMALVILAPPGKAAPCQAIHPGAMIETTQGYSITMGEGIAYVVKANVKYHDGQLVLCMFDTGLWLYIPSDWRPAFAAYSLTHDDYAWINDHGYKGTDGLHCCGWRDCTELRPDEVKINPDGGYSTPKGNIGLHGTYQSRDGKYWMCRFTSGPPKCLFVPGGS